MSDTALLPATPPAWLRLFGAEPRFAAGGLLIALSLTVTLAALAVDPRTFQGEPVWIKPIKFQLALTIFLLSLAFFARWLPPGMTARRGYRLYASFVVVAVLAELVWIGGAAMYGTASHFNRTEPIFVALYPVMGAIAVAFTLATLLYGAAIWRNRSTGLAAPVHLAVALGLVLTCLLTVPAAGIMSQMPGHLVGTPVSGAQVPLFGWSREVGDLRVAHFFATHAMHALPLAGLAATAALPERAALRAVWAAAVLWSALAAGTLAGALNGAPLIPLG